MIHIHLSTYINHAWGILKQTARRFDEARAAEAAASMAYYAFFSLFPLLLFLIAVGSLMLEREQAFRQVVDFVRNIFPASQELIEGNVREVMRLRGPVGIVGLVGLIWSATGFFTSLSYNVNRAWPQATRRSAVQRRLVALAMIAALVGLIALSLLSQAVFNLLPRLPVLGSVSILGSPVWTIVSNLLPWLFAFLTFLSLYRWIPNTKVEWKGALWGAGMAAIFWQIAASVFAWYVGSGFARYEWVYGSLGAVSVLMLWIYLSSWITLGGAHLSAVISGTAS